MRRSSGAPAEISSVHRAFRACDGLAVREDKTNEQSA